MIFHNQILDAFLDPSMNNSELAYMAANLRKNKRAKMTIVTVGKHPPPSDKMLGKIREKKAREASNSSDDEGLNII